MPDDVMKLEVAPGEMRAPTGVGACFAGVRRLKEDMVVEECEGTQAEEGSESRTRICRLRSSITEAAAAVTRRAPGVGGCVQRGGHVLSVLTAQRKSVRDMGQCQCSALASSTLRKHSCASHETTPVRPLSR